MEKKIIINCKNLSYLGINRAETIIREALAKAEMDIYVEVTRC